MTLSFLTRILRLTLPAPEIVTAVLDGTQFADLTLKTAMQHFPGE